MAIGEVAAFTIICEPRLVGCYRTGSTLVDLIPVHNYKRRIREISEYIRINMQAIDLRLSGANRKRRDAR